MRVLTLAKCDEVERGYWNVSWGSGAGGGIDLPPVGGCLNAARNAITFWWKGKICALCDSVHPLHHSKSLRVLSFNIQYAYDWGRPE